MIQEERIQVIIYLFVGLGRSVLHRSILITNNYGVLVIDHSSWL